MEPRGSSGSWCAPPSSWTEAGSLPPLGEAARCCGCGGEGSAVAGLDAGFRAGRAFLRRYWTGLSSAAGSVVMLPRRRPGIGLR